MGNEENEYYRFQEIWKVSSGRGKAESAEEDCDQIHLIKFDQVNLLFKHEYA